uniref:Uncharacterized protein n=1 Tax=Trichobilharzia regenti TaxID=157069 RepID=A0AA85IYR8_TRIRE|nr:unnamed protein product [Trichobilharzia regenti]
MMRLHVVSKHLLVANITLSILSAIGQYPESYAFYHSLLGYMLHSIPCVSILDCLLLWLPTLTNNTDKNNITSGSSSGNNSNNIITRDWCLFVYYVLKHWPRNPFYLDSSYQRRLVQPLENSYLNKVSKHTGRLALCHLIRTCKVKSVLVTCWPDDE